MGGFSSWIVPRGVAPDEHSNGRSESLIVCLGSEVHLRSVDKLTQRGLDPSRSSVVYVDSSEIVTAWK